jgi:alkylation response protein AidB-like acyl-CoA dehydrogenase
LRVIGVQKGPLLIENAQKVEAERVPSSAVYQAMYDAELFAMLAPRQYGGLELHPAECLRVWEAVARIDASAAGHVRQAGVDSRWSGNADRGRGSDRVGACRAKDGTFDGAATTIAAVKPCAFGAPLHGCWA